RNFSDLKNLSVELGVENSVTFTGWLRFKESTQMIQNSDVCIIPHLSTEHTNTTVPHKLFQYMYLKKPVLVSSSPPLKRIVQEANSGLVFDAGNSADFADKLVQMFESGNLQKWGENGHKAVLEKYNWKKESEKLIRIYRALLTG
ncbi:MAG TPA: glycosyltransferase, partial [Bacteroidetes bacterium]|nr:glycosyltransferase [Bacteroidota bacterium]